MGKGFFEAFPTLQLDKNLHDLFDGSVVSKVTTSKSKGRVSVYVTSQRLLHKSDVFKMEQEIKQQLFSDIVISVRIVESFELSAQYNPENLWEAYRESLAFEIRQKDPIMYNAFAEADINVSGDTFNITMVRDVFGRAASDGLVAFIKDVFENRCHMQVQVVPEFVEKTNFRYVKEGEDLIAKKVASVMDRLASDTEEPAKEETIIGKSAAKKPEGKAAEGKESALTKGGKKAPSGKKESSWKRNLAKKKAPDLIYGRNFGDDEPIMRLDEVLGEIGSVIVRGCISEEEIKEIREDLSLISFVITDYTDSISCKIFVKNDALLDAKEAIKIGEFVKIMGVVTYDTFEKDVVLSAKGIKKIPDFTVKRMDMATRKRVELHCHTKMSNMDAVSDCTELLKRAEKWGHPAIAITDHGVVQSFPDAYHAVCGGKYSGKVIYGCEIYLADDLRSIVENSKGQSLKSDYVVFDIETTGFSSEKDKIIEIGAVKVSGGNIVDRFSTFVNPERPIPFRIEQLTSINDSMVIDAPVIEEVLPKFLDFVGDCVLVAHNAGFDVGFIRKNARDLGIQTDFTVVDTVGLSRMLLPKLAKYKLDSVAKALKVSLDHHHRAVDDAECTAMIFVKEIEMLEERGIPDLDTLSTKGVLSKESIRKLPTFHAIVLCKNDVGRVNLYRLVSMSHLDYFHRHPVVPKSKLNELRDGLILGSACEAGELYRAIHDGRSEEIIAEIVDYYDYLEIQPIGNNRFMIDSDKSWVTSDEDLIEINKKIVRLGDAAGKPVVATCDVHFLDPEDEVYRRIIQKGNGYDDADNQAPLYFRTTEEMLDEFAYLGSDRAMEVVVDNTNKIADMCEVISPVRPDKCPPVIEDSDKQLTEICYKRAREVYGEDLPKPVEERLERELNSIISNGYAVMYIIAQKLVWKSVEDGYLVGSRGSVGSSFVATMAEITEVNPLSPHYYCPKCHYSDFESDEVKAYAGRGGCDMPDKKCPVCGADLKKDGFDIPFETFLGFKGDKEPDIDLNFSGEYQAKAHKYTEVLFGEGHTFKAGTIGTLADKTVYGYVKKYFEEKGIQKRKCEINRLVKGCLGVRRTTGQHPGGIVVLPHGEEINSFTPVQHPADDNDTDIITTHFDYHSIDHNLLKLDILGHDDPTMIKVLEDLTGINAREIPLDDPGVMSLFESTAALGITPEDIDGCPVGSLGIPEFGTKFVIDMLLDAKPKCFTDLVRIAGLGHGTDVWLGNAQELIRSGKATISTAICTRDDIMTYLINKGLEPADAFSIMENVRKGKVASGGCDKWPGWKEDMLAHDVPDWYIWSCEKIKYMFPKAHAAAYVMMAWRIAYFKINYPLAYYAAYFGVRAKGFDYEMMCFGPEKLDAMVNRLKHQAVLTANEENVLKTSAIVKEMYARGIEFAPIDLTKAKADRFIIDEGRIMPSFLSIAGMGDKAAEMVEIEASKGPFLSKDDFRDRTKVSKTITDLMCRLGVLHDIPETNQLSLFDLIN
ncbi:MAG: PolC-type DNA polymerase III [Lachnospiraceae bacterium]|nr:PolC-type DNA polymerase III [Lachnospiraceae bacterium]